MESKQTVVTITGIRPDFIRMSEIFRRFDLEFNHILIHSGQHYNELLSDIFFEGFGIRKPDYNLGVGGPGKEHFHQTAELSVKVIELFRKENIKPKVVVFLGDSNTVSIAPALKKEGYRIAHIEAGMRSYDDSMLEETNRKICDHCSDLLFVYHDNYRDKLIKEGISPSKIHVVGNTISEIMWKRTQELKVTRPRRDHVLVDIHRPENFKNKHRLSKIIEIASETGKRNNVPVFLIEFPRTCSYIEKFGIPMPENITIIPLMSFFKYTEMVYNSFVLISDSGTAQEEVGFLKKHVWVPREFTERPESYANGCSVQLNLNNPFTTVTYRWLNRKRTRANTRWMGLGNTSRLITDIINKAEL